MTIAHILSSFTLGGAEFMVCDLISKQVQHHQVHLIVLSDLIAPAMTGQLSPMVELHLLHRPPRSTSPLHLWRATLLLHKIRPDIVHYHLPRNRLLFFYPARHIITVHGMMQSYSATNRLALHRASRVVAVSRAVLNCLRTLYGIRRGEVIYNGVPTEKIVVRQRTEPHSPMRLVSVARLDTADKAQDVLLHALAKARHLAPHINFHLDFIGDGVSRSLLETRTHQLGLQDSVRFVGSLSRSEIYQRLADYDLMVHPSRAEGFGLAAVEGMAAELPLLVADCPALAEITQEGHYGAMFCTDSSDSCAEAIVRIAAHPRTVHRRAAAAREAVLRRFSLNAMANQYERIYRTC